MQDPHQCNAAPDDQRGHAGPGIVQPLFGRPSLTDGHQSRKGGGPLLYSKYHRSAPDCSRWRGRTHNLTSLAFHACVYKLHAEVNLQSGATARHSDACGSLQACPFARLWPRSPNPPLSSQEGHVGQRCSCALVSKESGRVWRYNCTQVVRPSIIEVH